MKKKKEKYYINPLLIPLKYKIYSEDSNFELFRKLKSQYEKGPAHRKSFAEIINDITHNKLTIEDEKVILITTNKFLLERLLNNKNENLIDKYQDDLILNPDWKILKDRLKNPVIEFIEIYFKGDKANEDKNRIRKYYK